MKIAYLGPITITSFQKQFDAPLPNTFQSNIFVPYINYLLQQGHEVVICTLGEGNGTPFTAHSGQLTIFVAPESGIGKVRAFTKWHSTIKHIVAFLKETPCDAYHANWTYEFALAALKADPDRTLVTMHDDPELIYQMMHDYYRKQRLKMSRDVFRQAKYLTGNSPYIIESVKKHQPHINPWLVPNLIETKPKVQAEKDENVLISINNGFDTRKNVGALLQAFAIAKQEIPSLVLKLYGDGYAPQKEAQTWAAEHNVPTDGVEFLGLQPYDAIQTALGTAGMLVHPSLEESFGMTLIEAMVNGTPVIGGVHSGAVPWVLEEGKAGLLADVTSPEAIAKTIVRLHQSKELQQQLIEHGYQRAACFSIDRVAQQFISIYQEMAEKVAGNQET